MAFTVKVLIGGLMTPPTRIGPYCAATPGRGLPAAAARVGAPAVDGDAILFAPSAGATVFTASAGFGVSDTSTAPGEFCPGGFSRDHRNGIANTSRTAAATASCVSVTRWRTFSAGGVRG